MSGKRYFNLRGKDRAAGRAGGWKKEWTENYFLPSSILRSSFLLLPLFLLAASPKHEYHVSVTQMQYNPALKSFEVSIRIFTDDFEKGLSDENGKKRFLIKNNDQNDPFVERYIRKNFVLTDAQKKAVNIKYVGKEQEEDATWVYLEISYSGTLAGCKLQNSILMEAFDDQVNMTNLKLSSDKKTFLFKKGQAVQSL